MTRTDSAQLPELPELPELPVPSEPLGPTVGWRGWRRLGMRWPPVTWTASPRWSGPSGSWSCSGGWTAWRASGARTGRGGCPGAAGADRGEHAPSTAGWPAAAAAAGRRGGPKQRSDRPGAVPGSALGDRPGPGQRPDRPGPCPGAGPGTRQLPDYLAAEAEPVLLEPASWTRPGCARPWAFWWRSPTPTGPTPPANGATGGGAVADRDLGQHGRRRWAVGGRGRPDRARRPGTAGPPGRCRRPHRGASGPPMPWPSWAAGPWPGAAGPGWWGPTPAAGDGGLDRLAGHPGGLGGDLGWAGPLDPAACRRLAGDGTLTRVLVTRHPTTSPRPDHDPTATTGAPTTPPPAMAAPPDSPPASIRAPPAPAARRRGCRGGCRRP